MTDLADIVDLDQHPIAGDTDFRERCRAQLDETGSLLLNDFIVDDALAEMKREALEGAHLAYYCSQTHTAYLSPPDPGFSEDHPRNRQVMSSKGCITDDQIPVASPLRWLYENKSFRDFLCVVLGEAELHNYADPLSSVNYHYYSEGQELGWHFDNSSFAVTLMIQCPEQGGVFQYIPALRDSESGDMNFEGVGEALDGRLDAISLDIRPGTLALFRGRNSLHRVTPTAGEIERIQVVLAYNTEPGIALSEPARLTFYGRIN